MKLKKFQKMITTMVSIFIILTTVWIMPIAAEDIPNEAGGIEETTEQVTVSDDTNTIEDAGEQVQQPSKEDSSDIVSDQVNEDVIIDDSNTDEVIEDTETTIVDEEITEPVEDVSFFAMLRAAPLENIKVRCVDEFYNNLEENYTLNVGEISNNVKKEIQKNNKRYTFKEARGIKKNQSYKELYVPFLYVARYNGRTYCSNDTITASLLNTDEEIILVYEEVKEQITVNFEVYVNGTKKNNYNSFVELVNITNGNVKSNKNKVFNFVAKAKKGYRLNNVVYNSNNITVTNGSYTTPVLTGDSTIKLYLNSINSADIKFDGYNTIYSTWKGDLKTGSVSSNLNQNTLQYTTRGAIDFTI